jgi:hypothetical protein
MYRLAAWVLLAALGTHLVLFVRCMPDTAASAVVSACSLALAGCLWFVAARQIGPVAGLFALALYVFSPPAWHPSPATATALAIFVFLATAVGVGHALQGPPRKWPPRFVLMAVLAVAAAFLQPLACFAALLLAAVALLYLTVHKRVWVGPIVVGLAAITGLIAHLRPGLISAFAAFFALAPSKSRPEQWAGILLALAAALALWAAKRRSRFFGNTAPLVAAVVFSAVFWFPGNTRFAWSCALPPALLFSAGVFADGFDDRDRRIWWLAVAWAACATQAAALFLLTS